MSDITIIRVTGGKMGAESFRETLEKCGLESSDNVIVTDEQADCLTREEALFFLEELARTLDVVEELEIDWEQVYGEL